MIVPLVLLNLIPNLMFVKHQTYFVDMHNYHLSFQI